jgi:hypothetical protein
VFEVRVYSKYQPRLASGTRNDVTI